MGVNPGTANGQLEVFINGQKIPRYVAGGTSLTDAYYTEITNDTIQLDSDYSGFNLSVEVIRPANVVDIGSQFALTNPVGIVLPYAGDAAGYLFCNGQTLNINTNPEYSALCNLIGSKYNLPGDPVGTCRLPNMVGVFPMGARMGAVTSQTIGAETYAAQIVGTRQNDSTAKNGLALSDPGHSHSITVYDDFNSPAGSLPAGHNNSSTPATASTASATTGITLGNGDTETKPASLSLSYIIKY